MIYKNHLLYLRNKINLIDQKLIKTFAKRQSIIKKIAIEKNDTSLPIRDITREKSLLKEVTNLGEKLNLNVDFVKNIFTLIIEYSVTTQKKILEKKNNFFPTVFAFLGPKGSYSHIAAINCKKNYKKIKEKTCSSFSEIIKSVENKQANFGILPLENTSSGAINEVYDLLKNTNLSIVGETYIPINHCLLAMPNTNLKNIKKIYSHSQPFKQCSKFMKKFPDWKIRHTLSSAEAIQHVAAIGKKNIAALGSETGGKYYKLQVLLKNISNQKNNITRFIILGNNPIKILEKKPIKTTLLLTLGKKIESLSEILTILKKNNLIINKIESRPICDLPWEEVFYIDILMHKQSSLSESVLTKLNNITKSLKILGYYQNIS